MKKVSKYRGKDTNEIYPPSIAYAQANDDL